ncbi:MAG: HEPN domain-containing protein [Nitrospirae bacterium]|nr:HEPN domain-containing protein [Nitrospirota bacterium]
METLSDLIKKISDGLKNLPIKVKSAAIYGSWTKGAQSKDSDIDILMISDEVNPRKQKRGKEIAIIKERLSIDVPLDILLLTTEECFSNFRNHNPLFLDLAWEGIVLIDRDDLLKSLIEETRAYISERKLKKLHDGWIFPVKDRTPVYLSSVSTKDFAEAMLTDGERDLEIGIKILESGYFDKAVYHFQQSVEKAVKAILICFGIFKKTHFVGEILLKELEKREFDDGWKEKLVQIARTSSEIEPEVTWSRYPGIDEGVLWLPFREYTEDDAREVREKCIETVKVAREFFEWWFK